MKVFLANLHSGESGFGYYADELSVLNGHLSVGRADWVERAQTKLSDLTDQDAEKLAAAGHLALSQLMNARLRSTQLLSGRLAAIASL